MIHLVTFVICSLFSFLSNEAYNLLSSDLSTLQYPQADCPRNSPEPAVDSTAYLNWHFKLLEPYHALESMTLKNGSDLKIHHLGCENYILKYQFESEHSAQYRDSILGFYQKAVFFLKEMSSNNISAIDMEAAVKAINLYINSDGKKIMAKQINFEDSEIPHFLYLGLKETNYTKPPVLEITFNIGPL